MTPPRMMNTAGILLPQALDAVEIDVLGIVRIIAQGQFIAGYVIPFGIAKGIACPMGLSVLGRKTNDRIIKGPTFHLLFFKSQQGPHSFLRAAPGEAVKFGTVIQADGNKQGTENGRDKIKRFAAAYQKSFLFMAVAQIATEFQAQQRSDDTGDDLGPAHGRQQQVAHSRRKFDAGKEQIK